MRAKQDEPDPSLTATRARFLDGLAALVHRLRRTMSRRFGWGEAMVSEEAVLKALDKPRKLFSIRQVTDPSGSDEALQVLLMKMRDAGKVGFDIKKGTWRKL